MNPMAVFLFLIVHLDLKNVIVRLIFSLGGEIPSPTGDFKAVRSLLLGLRLLIFDFVEIGFFIWSRFTLILQKKF